MSNNKNLFLNDLITLHFLIFEMSAQQLFAKIETPISLPGNPIADSMLSKITRFRSSIDQIKEENLDLERMRDQYIIHLQQCQEDHEILRNIYKSLKQKLDRATLSLESGAAQGNVAEEQAPMQASMQAAVPPQEIATIRQENPEVTFPVKSDSISVRLKAAFKVDNIICSVAYNKQGTQVAFSTGKHLFVLDANTGKLISQLNLPTTEKPQCRAIAFSPDGNYVAFTSYPNLIHVVYLPENAIKKSLTVGHNEFSALLYKSDGSWLISGSLDGSIVIWDTATYKEIKKIVPKEQKSDNAIVGIATAPEDSYYAVASTSGIFTIYTNEFENPTDFEAHSETMMGIAVSQFDETIATVSQDKTVKVWMLRVVASLKHKLTGHTDYTLTACFSPQRQILLSGSKDQTICVWNYKKGELRTSINAHTNTVFSIAHHPNQDQFVSVGGDHMICFWEYNEQ